MSGTAGSGSGASGSAAVQQAERWLQECMGHPDRLPDGVEPVQSRLVRHVGCGPLPDGGEGFVKVMGFPRFKDRIRYLFRPLPLAHEAAMLRRLRAAGIPAPEVLAVAGGRSMGVPRFSGLVTRGLDLAAVQDPGSLQERGALALRVLQAGIHHPDLHRGNFVRLGVAAGGGLGVLDFQSARMVADVPSLRAWCRRGMAARLLEEEAQGADGSDTGAAPEGEGGAGGSGSLGSGALDGWAWESLVASGLVEDGDRDRVFARLQRQQHQAVSRRVLRCLKTSTEFQVVGTWERTWCRRGKRPEGRWHAVGRRGRDLWVADRFLEITMGEAPRLWGLRRGPWWRGAGFSLYGPPDPARWSQAVAELEQAHQAWIRWQQRGAALR